ncbi:hypothetical protein ACFLR1_01525 [Bacteroidota bacterium]
MNKRTYMDCMNRPLSLFLTVFLLCSASGFAQKKADISAHFKSVYPVASEQLENSKVADATKNFLDLYELDSTNANINYQLGRCYLLTNGQRKEAIPYLSYAIKAVSDKYKDSYKETAAPVNVYFYLAHAYHLAFQFDDAITWYKKYLKEAKGLDRDRVTEIERVIQTCENGKLIVESPIGTETENLGSVINTIYDEYSAVVDANETTLIFTSRRPSSTGGFLDLDDKYYEDIFVSNKVDGEWEAPKSIGKNINTDGHEASIGLSADGQELYVYRDDFGDGNIYVSQLDNGVWGSLRKLNENINSSFRESHATVSADGQTLYFTSDRSGEGGMDIFISRRLPNGEWGLTLNLGDRINTEYEEEAPFIHPDGKTLFFSSKGHSSMGGYDIFFSILQDDGKWSTPMNIGYPMNTADDEYFFVMSPDGKRAYYSSSNGEGIGGKDVYLVRLDTDRDIPLAVYKGAIVADAQGNYPKDVLIKVTDNETGELYGEYRPRKDNGRFILILHPGHNYDISYEANDYLYKSEKLFVPENTAYFEINRAVQLKPLSLGK